MGSFIEIIQNYDQRMGNDNKYVSELNNWMTLLTRFSNAPLPKLLINQIHSHFSYYLANDRLSSISVDDEYLNQNPKMVKRFLVLNYLFDDIIWKFRSFFNYHENNSLDMNFVYDCVFGIKPRMFDSIERDVVILDEEDEVSEMYFIAEGTIGIGYYKFTQMLSSDKQF